MKIVQKLTLLTVLFGALSCAGMVSAATSASGPDIFSGRDMTIGSTGSDVVMLQGLLSELGYLNVPVSVPLGYFGSLTQKALASYQASLGVQPASGYFGPLTKYAMTASFKSHGWLALLGFAG